MDEILLNDIKWNEVDKIDEMNGLIMNNGLMIWIFIL